MLFDWPNEAVGIIVSLGISILGKTRNRLRCILRGHGWAYDPGDREREVCLLHVVHVLLDADAIQAAVAL